MSLQYDVNQTPTTGTEAVIQLITVLSSAGWPVHAYGDGSSRVGTGALPNASNMGNSSSWVAVRAPTGNHTLAFQRGTDNTLWWVGYAFGGLQTDGTGLLVDSPATGSDLKEVFNNGTTFTPGTLFPVDNVSGAFRFNVVAYDSSPYSWYAGAWNVATGEARTLLFFDGLTTHTNDPAKYVLHAQYRDTSPWVGQRDLLSHSTVSPAKTWVGKGLGGEAWVRSPPLTYQTSDGAIPFPRVLSPNPWDLNDDLAPIIYITSNGGVYHFKGVGSLFLWCGVSRATGDTFDITGETDDRVCVGDCAFPWPHGISAVV